MTEGTIVEWRKKEGEQVEKGEILYVLETEKISFEVEAPESGILGKIIAKEGDVIPVGGVVAYILQPGEKLAEVPEAAAAEEVKAPVEKKEAIVAVEGARLPEGIKVSPVARKIAKEHGIDISTVEGTGPGGRIVKEDVLRAVEKKEVKVEVPVAELGPKEKVIPFTTIRKTIARRISESFHTAPHFWETVDVDVSELLKARQELMPVIEKATGVRLTLTDLLIRIVAKVLEERPDVNSTYTDEGVKIFAEINIGIATDTDAGLVVPVLRRTNEKSLAEIAVARADLVTRAREKKLALDEITGGTFTLNNFGPVGIRGADSILNPPESTILTLGSIIDKPVVVGGEITIKPIMEMSIAIDHRVLDGVSGGRFLVRVKELVEKPSLMLL
jgi:pyruvate dehydrogenase E2 component (dihydrolipoamide acetyltransferase)